MKFSIYKSKLICIKILFLISGIFIFFTINMVQASSGGTGITNPLTGVNTIPELVAKVLSAVIGLIGILAVASFVYGGILYLTSAGNEEQSNKAKKVLGYSVMGLIVSILSYVIVNTVINIISG